MPNQRETVDTAVQEALTEEQLELVSGGLVPDGLGKYCDISLNRGLVSNQSFQQWRQGVTNPTSASATTSPTL